MVKAIKSIVFLTALTVAGTIALAGTTAPGQVKVAQSAPMTLGMFDFSAGKHVIGMIQQHTIRHPETLLDIARQYNLGFNEVQDRYPQLDPWLPPDGMVLEIPSQWILPDGFINGIIVNIAELRLYCFLATQRKVVTFPVGIGEKSWPIPEGTFAVKEKIRHPSWTVPPSLRHKYNFSSLAPGPDNPLGDYWIGLENTHYGIHGTDFPWSVGRTVTRGCIRLYPEDVERLFDLVQPGTAVKIIYAPVKIGMLADRVYVEVHRDIYNRIANFRQTGLSLLRMRNIAWRVDREKYLQALERQDGMPVDVTRALP